jgi:hypothetical protein
MESEYRPEFFEKGLQLHQETFYLYFQAYLKDVNHSQLSSTIAENSFCLVTRKA